jgi:hypothetical protein
MEKYIEDTVFETIIPINTIPVLKRFEEILKIHNTNSIIGLNDRRIPQLIMLLMLQYFKDVNIDMWELWKQYDKMYQDIKNTP